MDHVSVYVTCPDEAVAERIARDLLDRRLVACANVVPRIRSLYRWEGRVQDEAETLMFLKTRRALVPAVEEAIRQLHPYKVPCVVALAIVGGNEGYLAWLDESTRSG